MSEKEILEVEFLTPARITVKQGDQTFVRQVSIDLANRKVYSEDPDMQEMIFQFLDLTTPLPEDFFTASEEIQEKAQEAYDEARGAQDTHVGV